MKHLKLYEQDWWDKNDSFEEEIGGKKSDPIIDYLIERLRNRCHMEEDELDRIKDVLIRNNGVERKFYEIYNDDKFYGIYEGRSEVEAELLLISNLGNVEWDLDLTTELSNENRRQIKKTHSTNQIEALQFKRKKYNEEYWNKFPMRLNNV